MAITKITTYIERNSDEEATLSEPYLIPEESQALLTGSEFCLIFNYAHPFN
jgi:hypothetical protein